MEQARAWHDARKCPPLTHLQAALLALEAEEFPRPVPASALSVPNPEASTSSTHTHQTPPSLAASAPAPSPPPAHPPPMQQQQQQQQQPFVIRRGATDLKRALSQAQQGGRLLVVAWVQGSAGEQQQQQQQQQQQPPAPPAAPPCAPGSSLQPLVDAVQGLGVGLRVMLAHADVGASAANAGLAGALKVATLPALHVYEVRTHTDEVRWAACLHPCIGGAGGLPCVVRGPG